MVAARIGDIDVELEDGDVIELWQWDDETLNLVSLHKEEALELARFITDKFKEEA